MERFSDLALILRSFPYQDRDRIAVCLTENHGKVTALAKGAIHSRRFGGSLDLLTCSKLEFTQKPQAEMARIDQAVVRHEFTRISRDFEKLTAASFAAEFCLRLIEPQTPSREMFILLSNFLFQIDAGLRLSLAVNAFFCKAFKILGYPPSLLRCVQCAKGAHESSQFFWLSEAGGMVCQDCVNGKSRTSLDEETLLYFHGLTVTPFKELETFFKSSPDRGPQLYRVLADFFHHHMPGLPATGMKSWKLLNDAMLADLQPQAASRKLDSLGQ